MTLSHKGCRQSTGGSVSSKLGAWDPSPGRLLPFTMSTWEIKRAKARTEGPILHKGRDNQARRESKATNSLHHHLQPPPILLHPHPEIQDHKGILERGHQEAKERAKGTHTPTHHRSCVDSASWRAGATITSPRHAPIGLMPRGPWTGSKHVWPAGTWGGHANILSTPAPHGWQHVQKNGKIPPLAPREGPPHLHLALAAHRDMPLKETKGGIPLCHPGQGTTTQGLLSEARVLQGLGRGVRTHWEQVLQTTASPGGRDQDHSKAKGTITGNHKMTIFGHHSKRNG